MNSSIIIGDIGSKVMRFVNEVRLWIVRRPREAFDVGPKVGLEGSRLYLSVDEHSGNQTVPNLRTLVRFP